MRRLVSRTFVHEDRLSLMYTHWTTDEPTGLPRTPPASHPRPSARCKVPRGALGVCGGGAGIEACADCQLPGHPHWGRQVPSRLPRRGCLALARGRRHGACRGRGVFSLFTVSASRPAEPSCGRVEGSRVSAAASLQPRLGSRVSAAASPAESPSPCQPLAPPNLSPRRPPAPCRLTLMSGRDEAVRRRARLFVCPNS